MFRPCHDSVLDYTLVTPLHVSDLLPPHLTITSRHNLRTLTDVSLLSLLSFPHFQQLSSSLLSSEDSSTTPLFSLSSPGFLCPLTTKSSQILFLLLVVWISAISYDDGFGLLGRKRRNSQHLDHPAAYLFVLWNVTSDVPAATTTFFVTEIKSSDPSSCKPSSTVSADDSIH